MNENSIERLVGPEEVAEILGLSIKTVRAKHKKLGLPHYKVGWLIKYRISEVEQWLQKRHFDKNISMPKVVRNIKI